MSIAFPVSNIFTDHTIKTQLFKLRSRQEFSQTQGGRLIAKDFSRAIWTANYQSVTLNYADAVDLEALLHAMDGTVNTFLATDTRRPYPRDHSDGSFNDTGQINSINGNNKALTISGLDANFSLSRGDLFHFTYTDNSETIYSLHEVSESVVADGAGLTPEFEVRPHLPSQAAATDPVVFKIPKCLMVLEPDSVTYTEGASTLGTVGFNGIQKL